MRRGVLHTAQTKEIALGAARRAVLLRRGAELESAVAYLSCGLRNKHRRPADGRIVERNVEFAPVVVRIEIPNQALFGLILKLLLCGDRVDSHLEHLARDYSFGGGDAPRCYRQQHVWLKGERAASLDEDELERRLPNTHDWQTMYPGEKLAWLLDRVV
jgi:hypothetical protein